jgi:hypothetical protein
VLKEFVKEQHRVLTRLDLWSNRDQFYDHTKKQYDLEGMLSFIKENAKLAASKQNLMLTHEIKEHDVPLTGDGEFTCLATKLDAFISKVSEKYFI